MGEPQRGDLDTLLRAKIAAGTLPLPSGPPGKVWVGKGNGRICDVCDEPINDIHLEYEADLSDGHTLRFHQKCLGVWHQQRMAPPEISGGCAPSAWTLLFDLRAARRAAGTRGAFLELRSAVAESVLSSSQTRARSRTIRATSVVLRAHSESVRSWLC